MKFEINNLFFCLFFVWALVSRTPNIQVQTIVDHHHLSDQKQSATKVRFSEPGDENDPNANDNNAKVNVISTFLLVSTVLCC